MEHQRQRETDLQYRADLDGLRAVAVVPVVLYWEVPR
jgi:peptidoglycan/LPS O-acetylase OafA/YrhL